MPTAIASSGATWSLALGELSGQSYVFKVQAFAPEQGLQIAYAVAVDPFGKVCARGIGETDYRRSPAWARSSRGRRGRGGNIFAILVISS